MLTKEVPLDGALRQSLCEIMDDVKTYWMVSPTPTSCTFFGGVMVTLARPSTFSDRLV